MPASFVFDLWASAPAPGSFWSALLWMLFALALTVAVECGLVLIIFRDRQLGYCLLLCNLLTNPLLNFIVLVYTNIALQPIGPVALLILELGVVGVEAFIIHLMTTRRPLQSLLISLLVNTASFIVGLLFW